MKLIGNLPFSLRQRKLIHTRKAMSREEFIESIVNKGGDGEAASMLWEAIFSSRVIDGFTPYPDDSLGHLFGIAEEDLDEDIIMRIFHELNIPLPNTSFVKSFGPIDTALDVARLIRETRINSR